MSDREFQVVAIANSPVEFVLAGPIGRHRGILLRSENAGLDLVGAAAAAAKKDRGPVVSDALGLLVFGDSEVLAVQSHPFQNQPDIGGDSRLSDYTFVWRGLANRRQVKAVEDELARRAVDLHQGLELRDAAKLEWHVAPLVALCVQATQKRRHLRLLSLWVLGISGLGYAAVWFMMGT